MGRNETHRKQLNHFEDKHMRILKGYSKDQQKELEHTKNIMSCNNFLHIITYFPANVGCNPIKDKYDEADTDERISIIRDILDFYTGKAKFPEQKYYVKLLDKEEGYLNCQKSFNDYFVNNNKDDDSDYQTQFTMTEIEAIDPRYKQFALPVED